MKGLIEGQDRIHKHTLLQDDGFGSTTGEQQDEVTQLRAEIKELQNTAESANKDLQTAETHAREMQARYRTAPITQPP